MCGIAGIASLGPDPLPAPGITDAMCRLIVHRGPDDQGVRVTRRAQVGMRRLSIIDLAGGHQPIANEDGSVWVVLNGEIYNFAELRRDLVARGHRFATASDTECIVHGYEEYGEAVFARLRGMFAIAILDEKRQRLVLARDRLGKKPLYYGRIGGALAFASELKCFFAVPGFTPRVSGQAIREYFSLGYVPCPGTIYEDVEKLPPAHYLVLQDGHVSLHRYWALEYGPKWTDDDATLAERLIAHLDEAVRLRLVSDVPFGAFLSGGLDSSVVAALMARHMSSPVQAFTIGFREAAYDELPDARRIARHIGAEHHELLVEADAVRMLHTLAWHCDEPFADSSAIPTFLVSRLAAGRVKMVLSGDGGDEAFAGYERYGRQLRLEALARGTAGLAPAALRGAGRLVPGHLGNRLRRMGERMALPWPDRYLASVALSTPRDAASVLAPHLARRDPFARIRAGFDRAGMAQPVEAMVAGDVGTYLVDDVLVKVDRMTMANSLEARAPLLDHVLLEFCARLPFRLKREGAASKVLLRRVAAKLLPPEALAKRKQGFGIPLAEWFRGELRPVMEDLVADRAFRERGVFDAGAVRACLDAHGRGVDDHGELLWLVLTHESWARAFLDQPVAPAEPTRTGGARAPQPTAP
ncbi:MAG TPA: asparagine synthase (glutamine-hydrolyzing) [Usitatibacter sp.]|jgi:asparagine synthase (glutamine-hydrolysing)|nr:asparagine synthase (glutamine-hydrolyzing) [Usitatibacter sp.]